MKRKTAAFLLVLSLIFGMFSEVFPPHVYAASVFDPQPIVEDSCTHNTAEDTITLYSARPSFSGYLIKLTPQRVEDTFQYLDELYVEKHPEAALLFNTGTEKDRADIRKLAERVTAGCKTDTQKADAISSWLRENIVYDVNASAYASDTMYDGKGNCLSYANLMQFMLRSLGVPAVVGDGWRGNMKTSTIDLFNQEGHAWCFVRLNGEWVLYDPLWLEGGTTDRNYMKNNMYFDTVEFVCPVNDRDNLPPETYDRPKAYYNDGTIFLWCEVFDNTAGTISCFVNNQTYIFVSNQCEPENGIGDGWYYVYSDYDKTKMERGDVYCDSWISYGDYTTRNSMSLSYAHANGMHIDGAVMTLDGLDLLMESNQTWPILADKDDYSIMYGTFTLKKGYTGKFLDLPWQNLNGYRVTWKNSSPKIATVDSNNRITCHSEGFASFTILLERPEKDGSYTLMAITHLDILVSNDSRVLPKETLKTPTVSADNVLSSGKPQLTWKAVNGATKYKIYRSTSKSGKYSLLSTTSATSFTDTTAKAGTKYYYYLVAANANGKTSNKSSVVERTCDLARPTVTASNLASSGKVKLTWGKVTNAKSYQIYVSSDNKTWTLKDTVTGTTYTHTAGKAGNKYYYKVKALHNKSAANSAFSKVVNRTCDLSRPTLKISLNTKGKPVVNWTKVSGASKYTVYMYNSSGSLIKTSSTTGTKYTHSTATKGKSYNYRVVAVHSNSAASSAKSVSTTVKSK